MGPRTLSRGDKLVKIQTGCFGSASMGLRHLSRGDLTKTELDLIDQIWLQWGHGLSAVSPFEVFVYSFVLKT